MKNQRLRKLDFEKIIQKGENPLGFTSQTANGTAQDAWRASTMWSLAQVPQVEPDATRPAGRSNRTGE